MKKIATFEHNNTRFTHCPICKSSGLSTIIKSNHAACTYHWQLISSELRSQIKWIVKNDAPSIPGGWLSKAIACCKTNGDMFYSLYSRRKLISFLTNQENKVKTFFKNIDLLFVVSLVLMIFVLCGVLI